MAETERYDVEPIGIVTLLVGVLLLAGRGGFLVTPEATVAFYRRTLVEDPNLIRRFADMLVFLSLALLTVGRLSRPDHGDFTWVIEIMGWISAATAVWIHAEPSQYQRLLDSVLGMNEGRLRVLGVFGSVFGLWLVWSAFGFV